MGRGRIETRDQKREECFKEKGQRKRERRGVRERGKRKERAAVNEAAEVKWALPYEGRRTTPMALLRSIHTLIETYL